jgi:hypothetical protein
MAGIVETARNTASGAAQSARSAMSGAMEAVQNADHSEDRVARAIEEQTAKLPSDTFLWAALGSMGCRWVCSLPGEKR